MRPKLSFARVTLCEYAAFFGALAATLTELYEPFHLNDNVRARARLSRRRAEMRIPRSAYSARCSLASTVGSPPRARSPRRAQLTIPVFSSIALALGFSRTLHCEAESPFEVFAPGWFAR